MKTINQNPQRYSKNSSNWIISATGSIPPLVLPIGIEPANLTPVLEADGVVVEVGEWLLISKTTLDAINNSTNPHYDIIQNGIVKTTSGKSGYIGNTIPILKVDISKLPDIGSKRDVLNRNAGVEGVVYTYKKSDGGLPTGLIEQINYTLNKDIERKSDKFTLTQLQLSPIENYDVKTLTIVTQQDNVGGIFSQQKLMDFLMGISNRRAALTKDLNMIKDMFYGGILPQGGNVYSIEQLAQNEDDPNQSNTKQIMYKTSTIVTTDKTPVAKVQDQVIQQTQTLVAAQTGDQLAIQNLQAQVTSGGNVTQQAIDEINALQAKLNQQIPQQ